MRYSSLLKNQKYANLPMKILLIKNLKSNMKNILFCLRTNSLKANAGNFQFMILNGKNHRRRRMVINLSLSKKVMK